MTPNGLCDYILSGGIYEDCPSGDSDYAEMGKDIWPERMQRLVELAQRASKQDVKRESCRIIAQCDKRYEGCFYSCPDWQPPEGY